MLRGKTHLCRGLAGREKDDEIGCLLCTSSSSKEEKTDMRLVHAGGLGWSIHFLEQSWP
jgi:hypothetical protein